MRQNKPKDAEGAYGVPKLPFSTWVCLQSPSKHWKPQPAQMINFKRNKARGVWYGRARGLLQRFHEKTRLRGGTPFPLGFPSATRHSTCFSHIFPGIVQLLPRQRQQILEIEREDDRNHYRVRFHRNHVTLGGKFYVYAAAIHIGVALLCIMRVCFETKEEHFN